MRDPQRQKMKLLSVLGHFHGEPVTFLAGTRCAKFPVVCTQKPLGQG